MVGSSSRNTEVLYPENGGRYLFRDLGNQFSIDTAMWSLRLDSPPSLCLGYVVLGRYPRVWFVRIAVGFLSHSGPRN